MVIVLIIIMIMMIFSATILSISMSQSKTSHSQVDRIVTEELAKGDFWRAYNQATAGATPTFIYPSLYTSTFTANGTTYTATATHSPVSNPNVVTVAATTNNGSTF